MDEFYRVFFSISEIYKLSEEGHLYKLNCATDEWIDVSYEINFCSEWERISEQTLNKIRLIYYIEYFKYCFNQKSKDNKDLPHPGKTFLFFKYHNKIAAKDENGTEYLCYPDIMLYTDKNTINDDWIPLNYNEVIEEIKQENDFIYFEDMELYIDDNGELEGITEDLKQFRFSKFTGEISEVYEDIGIGEHWRPCPFSEAEKLLKGRECGVARYQLHRLKELNEYITRSRQNNSNITIGKDFKYFSNPYGEFYALDDLGNEFLCTPELLKPIKKGTIDTHWNFESRIYVLQDVNAYFNKNKNHASDKINILDLDLYLNQDGILSGVSKDGKRYTINLYTGEFEENHSSDKLLDPVDTKREGVKCQADLRYICKLDKYLDYCEDIAVKKGAKSFGEFRQFYIKKSDSENEFYGIDDNKQEYRCYYNHIEPVESGTIKTSFEELNYRYLLVLLEQNYRDNFSKGE